jgi:hypothetical protein
MLRLASSRTGWSLTFGTAILVFIACGSDDDGLFESAKPDAGIGGSAGAAGSAGSSSGGSAGSSGSSATGGSAGSSGSAGTGGGSGGTAGASGGAAGASGGAAGASGGAAGASGGAAGGAGAAGTPGTGGSAGAPSDGGCPDADGDGQTTCAGDCDDADANTFTGNTEACGDARDNDCDNQSDEGCGGIGTFVSANVGSDSNPGTQALPVQTIGQGMQNAQTIGGGVDVYIGEGHYTEKVTLVEGIDLLGGYQCDQSTCTWAQNSRLYDSAVFATDAEGMLATDAITRATHVDGLRIMGQDGSGTGRGRAALSLRGGSPTISNNRIVGPTVSNGTFTSARAIGILIQSPSNTVQGPLIVGNDINGGDSNGETAIGILMESATFPPTGNTYAEIRGNQIDAGEGRTTSGIAAWTSGAGTLVIDNDISAGSAGNGQAWGIAVGSVITIENNRINTGSSPGSCAVTGTSNYCGGIASFSATATITNNVILGLQVTQTVGVMLMEAEQPGGAVVLNGNYIMGSTRANSGPSPQFSAAVVLRIGTCTTCGFNGKIGKIRNNILRLGRATNRYGIYEDAPAGREQHPVALENNLFYGGPGLSAGDAFYRYSDGSTATPLTTITQVNGLATQIPTLIVGNNISADPLVDATFHLMNGSPCIEKGTATEAPAVDMDGEARPKGTAIDIGADEAG